MNKNLVHKYFSYVGCEEELNKIQKRYMMGRGGSSPKKIIEGGSKIFETKPTTIQTKNMAMQPFRPNKDTVDDQGKPLSSGMENHVCLFDDKTYEATSFFTRVATGPLGQKNDLVTPQLIQPTKQLHQMGRGQHLASTEHRYRVNPKHIKKVTDTNTVNYCKAEQGILQKIHNDNVQKHANNMTEIKYTTTPQELAQLRVKVNQELLSKTIQVQQNENNIPKDDEIF